MGASGSGRWGLHRKATTVERCQAIDLPAILRRAKPGEAGEIRWSRGGVELASVRFELVAGAGGPRAIRLSYRWTSWLPGAAPCDLSYEVTLVREAMPRGGFRWWGLCPLARGGVACGRRVVRLYQPPGGAHFGCRACWKLTYASRQKHDKRVTRLLKNPAALDALAANTRGMGVAGLGVLLQALDERIKRLSRPIGQPRCRQRAGVANPFAED